MCAKNNYLMFNFLHFKKLILWIFTALTFQHSFCQVKPTTTNDSTELKILTWNLFLLPPIVPVAGRMTRTEKIIEVLNESDYDLMVFQEAFHRKAVGKLKAGIQQKFPYQYGPFFETKKAFRTSSGVLICSKFPLEILDSVLFQAKNGIDKMANKGAVIVLGMKNGKAFQVITSHMQSDPQNDAVRAAQFTAMKKMADKHTKNNTPQIFAGDFNTERTNTAAYLEMQTILSAKDGLLSSLLTDTYDGKTNKIARGTWKAASTNFNYILLKENNAKIFSVKRNLKAFKRKWKKGNEDLSDHYALDCVIIF